MIYKHPKWNDDKHYSISSSGMGTFTVREFVNKCKKTELQITADDKINFVRMLKDNGWSEA